MVVFEFVDQHPHMGQSDIVKYFETKHSSALVFSQSALSRKLKQRKELTDRAESNPNALSSKRPRVVTRPDVERALVLWISHMEERGETVTGPMLKEKRRRFENLFDVPEDECLAGDGWLASFKRTYKLKEYRRHGEAGSVDLMAVEKERVRVQELMKLYAPRDRWNFDETSLFPMYVKMMSLIYLLTIMLLRASPDRGLASKQTSGKKKERFRITIGFACNSDGSEKMPPIFIGKAKRPRCFGKRTPIGHGFYYRNNKKAWMTSELFEE
jgi:hypothetical protein